MLLWRWAIWCVPCALLSDERLTTACTQLYASRARTAALSDATALRELVGAAVNRIAAARPERRAVGESVLKLIGSA